jgi:hypothetical protein
MKIEEGENEGENIGKKSKKNTVTSIKSIDIGYTICYDYFRKSKTLFY